MRSRVGWILLLLGLLALFPGSMSAQERWVYRYNGSGDNEDCARSITVAEDGNVYAAGLSTDSSTFYDFTVVSLDDSGEERWVYRYNGSSDAADVASSIIVGSDHNVYAAGYSMESGLYSDFTVVSLDDSGEERWVYQYENHEEPASDFAFSITEGSDHHLYVAGAAGRAAGGTNLVVVSLTYSGEERWAYRHEDNPNLMGAHSIVMGLDGNLYAAGRGTGWGTGDDFIAVSLTDLGEERWIYRYNGSADWHDEARLIGMSPDGNLYVAGASNSGDPEDDDVTVVSLDDRGEERWVYFYDSPFDDMDFAESMVMDWEGNLYVGGRSAGAGGSATDWDFLAISLSPSGEERWVYRYNGPRGRNDWARSMAMGSDSNLYMAGYSTGDGTYDDFIVVSLTLLGEERWVYRYKSAEDHADGAWSIAAGPDGNVYAAGGGVWAAPYDDFTVISLSPNVDADVAALSIDLPPDTVRADSTYSVRATVANIGSLAVTFDVVATIGGYADTVGVQNLVPDSSIMLDFQNWQVPSADSAVYAMTVCAYAAGDTNPANDCVQKSIFAYRPVHDVGVVSLDAPPDTVIPDSFYAVEATVHNSGTFLESFKVIATIGRFTDTVEVAGLVPGSTVQVSFHDWQVPPQDFFTYTMTVCTHLEEDEDSTNDCGQKAVLAYQEMHDCGVVSIDAPPDTVFTDSSYAVAAAVLNFGNVPSSFDVIASLDGYTDSVHVAGLAPDCVVHVLFSDWQVPSVDSTMYALEVCTHVVGDVDTTNDCKGKEIFAIEAIVHDCGVVSIDAPGDTVVCGSVRPVEATVCNLGNVSETFSIVATIDGFADTVVVSGLAPDSALRVSFVDWLVPEADSVTYAMSVCTYVAGDIDSTNDCAQKSVFALCVAHDVGVVSLDAPPDTVFPDSIYAVAATVCNLGTFPENLEVVATIGAYADTVEVTGLAPDSTMGVAFRSWRVPSGDSAIYAMVVRAYAIEDVDTSNNHMEKLIFAQAPVGVEERSLWGRDITGYRLNRNYPNPFAARTVISYSMPVAGWVTLEVHDIAGRLVEILVDEAQDPGMHQVRWHRESNPSGAYFYTLRTGGPVKTRKMVVVD